MTRRLDVLVTGATGKQGGTVARELLAGEHDRFVVVELRGITGLATVGSVLTSQELPQ